jgi:hypothetical protein
MPGSMAPTWAYLPSLNHMRCTPLPGELDASRSRAGSVGFSMLYMRMPASLGVLAGEIAIEVGTLLILNQDMSPAICTLCAVGVWRVRHLASPPCGSAGSATSTMLSAIGDVPR